MRNMTKKIPLFLLYLLILCFMIAEAEMLLDNQTISLNYVTMTNYQLANWDTCFCVIKKWDNTVIDTVGLAHSKPGRWTGTYSASGLKGGYHKEYYCIDGDDTTMESYAFSIQDADDFKDGTGCTAPTGSYQVTLLIADNEDTSAVSQCLVQIWNKGDTQLEWWDYTNSSGQITFLYDTDTLMIKCYKAHYVFTVPESLFITDDVTDTIYGSTSLVFPPAANLCRIYGYIFDQTGEEDTTILVKIENVVYDSSEKTTEITVPLRYEKAIISPYVKYTTPDTTGYFCFDVYRTVSLTPDSTYYLLTATDSQGNELLKRSTGEMGILFQAPDTTEYWIEW